MVHGSVNGVLVHEGVVLNGGWTSWSEEATIQDLRRLQEASKQSTVQLRNCLWLKNSSDILLQQR